MPTRSFAFESQKYAAGSFDLAARLARGPGSRSRCGTGTTVVYGVLYLYGCVRVCQYVTTGGGEGVVIKIALGMIFRV